MMTRMSKVTTHPAITFTKNVGNNFHWEKNLKTTHNVYLVIMLFAVSVSFLLVMAMTKKRFLAHGTNKMLQALLLLQNCDIAVWKKTVLFFLMKIVITTEEEPQHASFCQVQ